MVCLLQFQVERLLLCGWLRSSRVLACKPGLELLVLAVKQFEDFTHDVGRIRIEEFSAPVQIDSDVFLQANLKEGSLWLFRWCLQKSQAIFSFRHSGCITACITRCMVRSFGAGKALLLLSAVGWSDPTGHFGHAVRRKVGSLQPTPVFCPRPNSCRASRNLRTPVTLRSLLGEQHGERRVDLCLSCACHPVR